MYEHRSAYHRLRVTDSNGVRSLIFEHNHQSSMHLDNPFESDIEYVGYLHLTLAVTPNAKRTLVLGLGGGSVVKRMWRDYPAMRLDVVELDPEVADVARELFALPTDPRISVIIDDGRAFVGRAAGPYDIIIVDAFDDDVIPRPLMTEEFLRECRDLLGPDGVIAYNVIGSVQGDSSKQFRSLHKTASNVWRTVWTFVVGHADGFPGSTGNLVMLATDAELTEDELLERIGMRVGGLVTVPAFERFAEHLYRGSIRTGDVPIICDPPAPARRTRR